MRLNKLLVLSCFSILSILTVSASAANFTIKGQLRDAETQLPLEGATVGLQETEISAISDKDGRFELRDVAAGNYTLLLNAENYVELEMDIALGVSDAGAKTLNLGVIQLLPRQEAGEVNTEDFIPTITLTDEDLEQETDNQNISGILSASRDVFVSAAAFTFGPARFRIRGYDSENTLVYLNGIPMNDLENGRVFWSIWAGLNDVTRNRDTDVGLGSMGYTLGGIGGGTTIDTRASTQRKQKRFSYSLANRSYRQRLMATYSTGWLEGDWAVSLSGSRRWAEEGYIPGTFYDAWSYFASIDKKLNDEHTLNLTAFGAPVKRGRSGASVQEMYDLAGTNYYNPNWGYQNGKKRNSRVVDAHQPTVILRHDWNISETASLTSALGYQFGYYGSSALDWFDADDPRPDYYRYLPSYAESNNQLYAAEVIKTDLTSSESARQLNWDEFYFINRTNVTAARGVYNFLLDGQDYSGQWSQYIVEDRRFDAQKLNFYANYQDVVSDQFTFSMGLAYQSQTVNNYKILEDLLGGDFYLNIDRFAVRDFAGDLETAKNNQDDPNLILREGDVFGYNYDANIRKGELWAQGQWSNRNWEAFLAARASSTSFWRTGNYRNGRFPDTSLGDSEKQQFTNYSFKGGLTYKLSGRHYFYANGLYQTRAPFFRNAYVSPRTRDQLLPNLTSETIYSGETGYYLRSPSLKARASLYYTQFQNQVDIIRFFNDLDRDFGNYILSGLDKLHFGAELAVEAKISAEWSVSAVAALGQYTYNSRAIGYIYQDNREDIQRPAEAFTVYTDNFYVPGTPQTAYTLKLSYNSPNYWFANLNFNYFDNIYIDFNPLRRTTDAVIGLDEESEQFRQITRQEKVQSAFTVDFFGGKSFKFGDYFLYLNLGVSNILNNKNFITGGYEQARFDVAERNPEAFPARYFYSYGTNFFANLSLRF